LRPQFRLDLQLEGDTRRFEVEVNETWEATTLLAELTPKLPPNTRELTLKIVTASANLVRVQLITTMRLEYEGKWDMLGFDLLETADTHAMTLVGWLAGRERASVEEVAHFLEQTEQASQMVLSRLMEQGVLLETREEGEAFYQVHFAARRRRQATTAIWRALDGPGEVAVHKRNAAQSMKKGMRLSRMKEWVQGEQARSWLALGPLFLIFLLVEWLFVNKLESFSQLLSFVGVVAIAVTAGVFPVLLLLASRRKGVNVPGFVLPFLAHPIVAGGIYLVAVSILFLHGLLIWQNLFQRAVAILVGVVILGVTHLMVRKGAFARRVVIEVRQDPAVTEQSGGTFMVTDCGRAATQARIWLGYPDGERVYQGALGAIPEFGDLCSAKFHVPVIKAQELMIWVHRVTPEGQSENLPALLKVSSGTKIREFHVDGVSKQFILSLRDIVKKDSKGSARETDQLEIEVQLAGNTVGKK